jgi:hypothetical protein
MRPTASRETVLEAIRILNENGQAATRHTIADLSGMPLVRVDDNIKRLHNEGEIHRVGRGQYAPAPPARPTRAVRWGCIGAGQWFFEAGSERIDINVDEPHDLMRSEQDGAVVYALADQRIELSTGEDMRASILRMAAVLGADWRDAFESPAERLERVMDAVRLARWPQKSRPVGESH